MILITTINAMITSHCIAMMIRNRMLIWSWSWRLMEEGKLRMYKILFSEMNESISWERKNPKTPIYRPSRAVPSSWKSPTSIPASLTFGYVGVFFFLQVTSRVFLRLRIHFFVVLNLGVTNLVGEYSSRCGGGGGWGVGKVLVGCVS